MSTETVFCLTYSSKLACSESEVPSLVAQIVAASAPRNQSTHIGGVLRFRLGSVTITQALEGSEQAVRDLYNKISSDPRHTEVQIVREEKHPYRKYEQFGMLQGNLTEVQLGDAGDVFQMEGDLGHVWGVSPVEQRVVYRSILATRDPTEADKLMTDILASSTRNNMVSGIGGILFFNRDSSQISQVLEGPPENIDALLARIAGDARHRHFRIVRKCYSETKQYSQFGMVWGGSWDPETAEDDDPFDWARTDPSRTSQSATPNNVDQQMPIVEPAGCCNLL